MFAKRVHRTLLLCLYLNLFVIISFIIANNGMFMKLVTVNNIETNNGDHSRLSRRHEPIDVVYTWVNESDTKFVQDLITWKEKHGDVHYGSSESKRFTNWNTLLFSLRSIEKYADWIRHVFIVTNGQIPQWLNLSCPRVTIVTHEEIFINKSHLPTFSSCAIETHIHRIRGLSKRFLYLNDDILFGQPVTLEDFYSKQNGTVLRFSRTYVRHCTAECSIVKINNNQCEEECNKEQCEWDGRDCGIKNDSENVDVALVKNFDLYHGAIFHTAALFNAAYGNVNRLVPAHVPHFIDRDLMTELQNRFPIEWGQTSFHRFRKAITLQYAFAYYHFIMAPTHNETMNKQTRFTITKSEHLYLIIKTPDKLIKTLGNILNNEVRRKFLCLNDHSNFKNDEEKAYMQTIVTDFLTKLFPTPSEFEKLNIV